MMKANAQEQAQCTAVETNELKQVEGGVCDYSTGHGIPHSPSVPHPKDPPGIPFPKLG
jgi:hypothetical protein